MKKITLIILFILTLSIFSCKENKLMYSYDKVKLVFDFERNQDSITRKSFMYDKVDVKQDTIWVKVRTQGFVSNTDRVVDIKQVIIDDKENAQAGVHYIDFNNSELKKHYKIGAGKAEALFPIVAIRDVSLKTKAVYLNITFQENDNFVLGKDAIKTIEITELLPKPTSWDALFERSWGTYSRVKHEFLINATNEPWDNDFITANKSSVSYMSYLKEIATTALKEHNLWLSTQPSENGGPGPLKDENGNVVVFEYVVPR